VSEPTSFPTPPASPRAYWACQIVGWGGVALIQILAVYWFMPGFALVALTETRPTIEPLATQIPPWTVGVPQILMLHAAALAFSHALRRFARQRHWDLLDWRALAPRIAGAGLVLGLPLGFAMEFMAVGRALNPQPAGTPAWLWPLQHSINWSAFLWVWQIIYFSAIAARRRRYAELRQSELARALQAAELRALKAQVNPHFLFNSLNSVRALIADDPKRAQDAVTRLARTLRYSLGAGQEELVTLKQEMEIVDDYLSLESLRLGARLRIERAVSEDAGHVRVPVMLLQTVVENAIKHGIAELPWGGVLRISGQARNGALELAIENPRPQTVNGNTVGSGVGMKNSAERLRLLFGAAASLDLDLSSADRAVTRIRIPVTA
jgi:two-component system sensor histidine kinase AlgZ